MSFLSFLRRKKKVNTEIRQKAESQDSVAAKLSDGYKITDNGPEPLADWERDLLEGRIGAGASDDAIAVRPTAESLPSGFSNLIPVGSTWKRKPPKKEILRVNRVWYLSKGLSGKHPRDGGTERRKIDGYKDYGWTVRAVPVRGGRPLVADAQWFLDNFDHQADS